MKENLTSAATILAVVAMPWSYARAVVTCTGSGAAGDEIVLYFPAGFPGLLVGMCVPDQFQNPRWVICPERPDTDYDGILDGDVEIYGLGSNDRLWVREQAGTWTPCSSVGCCSEQTAQDWSNYNGHTVTLNGDEGPDIMGVAGTGGGVGSVDFYGGTGNDQVQATTYAANLINGGIGEDVLIDTGGSGDVIFGGSEDDCLEDFSGWGQFDCGAGADDLEATGGNPPNCEHPVDCCGLC